MSIETIQRCSICKKEGCNGKEYYVPRFDVQLKSPLSTIIVCSSQIKMSEDGLPMYKEIVGHGIVNFWGAYLVKKAFLI